MTKDEFMKKLKEALKNGDVKDSQTIIDKYENRFKLAKEAGFSEEEAIQKFGEPQAIAEALKPKVETKPVVEVISKDNKDTTHVTDSNKETVVLSLIADDVNIDYGDVDGPYVDFNDANPDDYVIEKDEKTHNFKLEFRPKAKFFSSMHRSHLNIILPRGIVLGSLRISVISSKVNFGDIISDEVKVSTVSGAVQAGDIRSDYISFSMVSGNVNAKSVVTQKLKLTTVSGNFSTDQGEITDLEVNGVSGSVKVLTGHVTNVKASVLSGKVTVNGEIRK